MSARSLRSTFRYGVLAVVLVSLLAACAPAFAPTVAPAPPTPAMQPTAASVQPTVAPSAEPIKIVFWSHDFPPREKLDRKYIAKFEEENPGVKVDYVIGPGDDAQYITKLMTAMASGEGPDCFNLLSMGAGPLLGQGAVAPVDPKVYGFDSQQALEKSYVEGTLEGFKYDGKLYAVPSEVSLYSLFINKDLFAKAGLDADKDYPKTWEDLIPLARKLNKTENGQLVQRAFDFTYGMADDGTSPVLTLAGMAYQLGGTVLNADASEATVDTEPWVRSLQFMQDWVYKEKLGNPALTVSTIGFYEGSVAMALSGSWYSSYVKDQNEAVYRVHTVKPLPRWKDAINNTGAYMYAYGLFVNAASSPEKQALCQKLIKELSSHSEEYLSEAGLLQPTMALAGSQAIKQVPNMDVFLSDMKGTPYWPAHPKTFEISDALTRAVQRAVTENQPAAEALRQAKQEIDALLKEQ